MIELTEEEVEFYCRWGYKCFHKQAFNQSDWEDYWQEQDKPLPIAMDNLHTRLWLIKNKLPMLKRYLEKDGQVTVERYDPNEESQCVSLYERIPSLNPKKVEDVK